MTLTPNSYSLPVQPEGTVMGACSTLRQIQTEFLNITYIVFLRVKFVFYYRLET
jgi:hypothetical protein